METIRKYFSQRADIKRSTEEEEPVLDYFYTQKRWMLLTGVWPPITIKNPIFRGLVILIHWIYNVFLCMVTLHVAVMFYVTFYLEVQTASFARIAYCLSQAVIFSFATFSVAYLQIRADMCKKMVDYMNENFRYRSAPGLTFVNARKAFNVTSLITSWYIYVSEVSVLQRVVFPLFEEERSLPLVCWYPFDEHASPMYEIVYGIQTIAQIQLALIFCTSSAYTLSASILICAQYDLLFCSLKNLKFTAIISSGSGILNLKLQQLLAKVNLADERKYSRLYISEEMKDVVEKSIPKKNIKRRKYPTSDKYQMHLVDELNDALCDCIRHHQIIVESCRKLEDISSPWVLVKSIEISFQICILALTFVKTTGSIIDNINTAQYIALTLIDLFIISYMGQIMLNQSVRVRDFLFDTPWYGFGAPIRRTMLIILMYTMKPQIVSGGKFFVMGYDKCIAIMKLSFSYFTLLDNIGSK